MLQNASKESKELRWLNDETEYLPKDYDMSFFVELWALKK